MASQNRNTLSRRDFLQTSAMAASVTWFGLSSPAHLLAQADPVSQMRAAGAAAKITTLPARRNVSVLMGSGGNIAVLTGKEGKLLVDSGFASSRPQITEALAGLRDLDKEPLKHLIDTHWHFDHTDGNEWMHAMGAAILAHENTKKRLSTPQVIAAFNASFPPAPAGALPTSVFDREHLLSLNGENLHLSHYAPAHTDSDISVHFAEADVFHTGDTWFNGFFPFIDYSSGGNINGMVGAAAVTLSKVGAKTIIIPGHGPVGDKTQFIEYSDMLTDIRDKVAVLKKQGKSMDEAVAAKPTAKYDAKWGVGLVAPDNFTKLVYAGV